MKAFSTCAIILKRSLSSLTKKNIQAMADFSPADGFSLKDVVNKLNEFAPTTLAESWDNTGLLIEPYTPKMIKKILLTNDLTEIVMKEALDTKVELIISYHPPIFSPLKSITRRSWKERVVSQCLENRVALYSPHTAWDAVAGGVNDWLASALPAHTRSPIVPKEDPSVGCGRMCVLESGVSLQEAVELVKARCGLQYVRLAAGAGTGAHTRVGRVALCAGSGASLLRGVKADLYITGEMLHHEVLEAVHNNVSVILTNHSDSERGFLAEFRPKLSELLQHRVEIRLSETDRDPLTTL